MWRISEWKMGVTYQNGAWPNAGHKPAAYQWGKKKLKEKEEFITYWSGKQTFKTYKECIKEHKMK